MTQLNAESATRICDAWMKEYADAREEARQKDERLSYTLMGSPPDVPPQPRIKKNCPKAADQNNWSPLRSCRKKAPEDEKQVLICPPGAQQAIVYSAKKADVGSPCRAGNTTTIRFGNGVAKHCYSPQKRACSDIYDPSDDSTSQSKEEPADENRSPCEAERIAQTHTQSEVKQAAQGFITKEKQDAQNSGHTPVPQDDRVAELLTLIGVDKAKLAKLLVLPDVQPSCTISGLTCEQASQIRNFLHNCDKEREEAPVDPCSPNSQRCATDVLCGASTTSSTKTTSTSSSDCEEPCRPQAAPRKTTRKSVQTSFNICDAEASASPKKKLNIQPVPSPRLKKLQKMQAVGTECMPSYFTSPCAPTTDCETTFDTGNCDTLFESTEPDMRPIADQIRKSIWKERTGSKKRRPDRWNCRLECVCDTECSTATTKSTRCPKRNSKPDIKDLEKVLRKLEKLECEAKTLISESERVQRCEKECKKAKRNECEDSSKRKIKSFRYREYCPPRCEPKSRKCQEEPRCCCEEKKLVSCCCCCCANNKDSKAKEETPPPQPPKPVEEPVEEVWEDGGYETEEGGYGEEEYYGEDGEYGEEDYGEGEGYDEQGNAYPAYPVASPVGPPPPTLPGRTAYGQRIQKAHSKQGPVAPLKPDAQRTSPPVAPSSQKRKSGAPGGGQPRSSSKTEESPRPYSVALGAAMEPTSPQVENVKKKNGCCRR